jgi:hypothetical protein
MERSSPPTSQVTDRDRRLESGGAWEAPTDPPGASEGGGPAPVGDADRRLEPGGFWEAPVGPDEVPPTARS